MGKKIFYARILAAFLLGQGLFSIWSISALFDYHLRISRSMAFQLAEGLAMDLNRIDGRGVGIGEVANLKPHLESLLKRMPQVATLTIRRGELAITGDLTGQPAPDPAGRADLANPADPDERADPDEWAGDNLTVSVPFHGGGQVEATLSAAEISSARLDLVLDNVFLTMVSCLGLLELLSYLVGRLRRKTALTVTGDTDLPESPEASGLSEAPELAKAQVPTVTPGQAEGQKPGEGPDPDQGCPPCSTEGPAFQGLGIIRPLVFMALLSLDLALGFIPLAMGALTPATGTILPRGIMLGLSVSVQLAAGSLAMLLGGRLVNKLGGLSPVICGGLLMSGLGALGGAFSWNPWLYLASMAFFGAGYGVIYLVSHLQANQATTPNCLGEAMGEVAAGTFSGSLVGCLVGGMLADRFGYAPVFILSASLFFALAILWPLLVPSPKPAGPVSAGASPAGPDLAEGEAKRASGAWAFLGRRRVVALFLFSVFPIGMSTIGVFNFFVPVHLSGLGYGPAMVGRLNILMSMMVILLGPALGRVTDRSRRPHAWLAAAGLLGALSIPSYLIWPNLAGTVLGVALVGLALALTEGGHPSYVLALRETKLVGPDQAMGFYSSFSRMGRMAGPILVGAALGGWGFSGLMVLGVGVGIVSALFFILSAPPGPDQSPA
jgi:predicted MFS family arabinose efflux permease